jgi:hypothetical protein
MKSPRVVRLDPRSDNRIPTGYVVIQDQVGFVKSALGDEPIQVQGEDLCRWAHDYGVGRGWKIISLKSPVQELIEQCPGLTSDEAGAILDQLGERAASLFRPLRLHDVAAACWDQPELLNADPSQDHAFRWLRWLANQPPAESKLKLLRPLLQHWQATGLPILRSAYAATTPAEAWTILNEWLRVIPSKQEWPIAPSVIEADLARRLGEDRIREAVETGTDFFAELLDREAQLPLLRIAAKACASVLKATPNLATEERVHRLRPYLSHDLWTELTILVQPTNPGIPEWQFDRLAEWYVDQYLPYREWVARSSPPDRQDEWSAGHSEEFARGFLTFYANARAGGDGEPHLAWTRSAHLRSPAADCIQLLVVCDGLTYPDALKLKEYLAVESPRLVLDVEALALAPLPTVTNFAKAAVAKGLVPSEALVAIEPRSFTSVDAAAEGLRVASHGATIVWTLMEPDHSYHFRADVGDVNVRYRIESELQTLAKQIAWMTNHAKADLRLRVVVTTDHGRLLTRASRTHAIPEGMKAHGRAAWGVHPVRFDPSGLHFADGLAFLHPSRFGLPSEQNYAVIVSAEVFLTADDQGGIEPFPHGGVFPEEVLIPWLEFSRDREPVKVAVTLSGKGEEGKAGYAELTISNLGPVAITAVYVKLPWTTVRLPQEYLVGSFSQVVVRVPLDPWPAKVASHDLIGSLTFRLPDGAVASSEFRPQLEIESLYERDDDLLKEFGELP